MCKEYAIGACSAKAVPVKRGQMVAIEDAEGGQVADFFAAAADREDEFLSPGVTIDCNESLNLRVGDVIYSNLYRPMFTVTSDDVGAHDLLHPCCRPEMYDFFYGNGNGHPNCHDNINACLGRKLPVIQPVNFFMNTKVYPDGRIAVLPPLSRAGDKVVLRAETDAVICVAACSVSESACNGGKCTGIKVTVSD